MIAWKNLDKLDSYKALLETKGQVKLAEVMEGRSGADRVRKYAVPMAGGLTYHYAAKKVDDDILEKLVSLAKEAQLSEKFEELYNGAVINLTENRHVLHQLTRGQLGGQVIADGVDKREFYKGEQIRGSRQRSRRSRIRCMPARLQMGMARGSIPLCRSASAEAIWARARYIWRWRTGRSRTIH